VLVKPATRWTLSAAAIALLAYGYLRASRVEPIAVAVRAVDLGPIEKVVANTRAGTVDARKRARLAPAQGGIVSRLLVVEGQRVSAQDLLVELQCEDLRAQLAVARAQIERSHAQWDELRLRAELAEREAERERQLLDEGASTGERLDRAEIAAQSARAAQRALEQEAQVHESEARLWQARIAQMEVRAPFSGIVAEVHGEVGEFATPSPVGVATLPTIDLIDDSAPYVTAPIDEVDAALVQVGMRVRIALDAFPQRTMWGCVRRIAPYVQDREKQARTVDVEVDFEESPAALSLLIGYSADVEIVVARVDRALRIEAEAVREGTALVLGDDGRLVSRRVRTGVADWQRVEILEGLAEGERVVVSRDRKGAVEGAMARPDLEGNAP
jgi:HlyD family secretion protein